MIKRSTILYSLAGLVIFVVAIVIGTVFIKNKIIPTISSRQDVQEENGILQKSMSETKVEHPAPVKGNFDTDGDGLDNEAEKNLGTDPNVADFTLQGQDTDRDSVPDVLEIKLGWNINNSDTDGDGLGDGAEMELLAGGIKDDDNDGLSEADEVQYGTDPKNPDSDGDGFKDGVEVQGGYNPKGPGKL